MYRQGDILIVHAHSLPDKAKRLPHKIVARGELTGHRHRFEGEAVLYEDERNEMFIQVAKPASLVHEEHDTIIIPEGSYHVIRQREFTGEEVRYVLD